MILLLLGCPNPCPPDATRSLQIGTGDRDFTLVASGDTVDEVFGNQGGYHYEMAIRVTGLTRGDATVYTQTFFEGEMVSDNTFTAKLKCDGSEEALFDADLRLSPLLPWDSADTGWPDRTVRGEIEVQVRVEDSEGAEVSGTTIWRVDP